MTPKTKLDPKGDKKPVKKTMKTSSTLMAITKLGGGMKGEGRGSGAKKTGGEEAKKRETELQYRGKETIEDKGKSGANFQKQRDDSEDIRRSEANGDKETEWTEARYGRNVRMEVEDELVERGSKASDNEKMVGDSEDEVDIVVSSGELVSECEDHLRELEKEMESVEPKNKIALMTRVHSAQRRLKDALLNLEVAKRMKEDKRSMEIKKKERGQKTNEASIIIIDEMEEEADSPKDGYVGEPRRVGNGESLEGGKATSDRRTEEVSKTSGSVRKEMRWADMDSEDDDTVILQNRSKNQEDEMWETVKHKKAEKHNKKQGEKNENKDEGKKSIMKNPYYKDITKEVNENNGKVSEDSRHSSLTSFAEKVRTNNRDANKNSIRVTFSFTPRTTGPEEFKRIAKELLSYANEIDDRVMLLPWEDSSIHGPIKLVDLANPRTMLDSIKLYFARPARATWQAGVAIYGVGVRFSSDLEKNGFIDNWNMKKREYKSKNMAAYNIVLAPVQKSSKAFIIGMAVGSTENQDIELLNQRLEEATGIKGIEASFQNINQYGVTSEFWKIANTKATKANKDKMAREHLRTKYRWAPNAVAFYVPTKEAEGIARKILLHKYGKATEGKDPIWPDGSSMRFLPIKGTGIKSDKTREIVRKRMAYHIWLKANEVTVETMFTNIHDSIDNFQGKTFADIVLELTNQDDGFRYFTHFNRAWSPDITNQRWNLSVRGHLFEKARMILADIKETLVDKYGIEVEKFFIDEKTTRQTWTNIVTAGTNQDDDDNWFDDDEDYIEIMIEKGIVDSSFLQFLQKKDDDSEKQSVASWGTGETTYTELVNIQRTHDTSTSSLTNDSSLTMAEEKQRRISGVKAKLKEKGIDEEEIEVMCSAQAPYDLAFSGAHLPTWDVNKEVFLLLAIREQYKQINNNDE